MAEVAKGIIDIEINTGSAASQLQALQSQINAFSLALNKNNATQGKFAAKYSKELQDAINKTGMFTAETVRLSTAAATLDKTLSKGKTSLGQYFSARFNKDGAMAAETLALAGERARRLQTQFIATSAASNGFQEALAVRPLAAFSSEAAVAAQRTQILSSMFKQGTTQLINFGKNVQWAGRQLMVGFTVPLTIFGAVAGKTFMQLEKEVVSFKKVYGDLFTTPAELNQNLEAVKGLAAEYTKYGIAVKDTIGLAAEAAAAGRQGVELTDATTQATRLSVLGQMDQNQALETTISLQSAFKLSGQDLADTINFLNMVENQTVVTLQDIANAIPRVAPVIAGLGGDVKDLTVFLAAMQEGGVNANEGANALKSGLASLINPTKQATAMLSGFGINLDAIIQANKGDLMGTVQSFAQALATLDQFSRQQALEQVFGKFQYAKLGALFDNITREGSQAQQVIETMAYSTEQLASTADKELKTIEESFGVQLTGAVERFKLAIAPIGELFVRLAIPLVNFATKIAESFNSLSDGQKRFAAIAAVIVGVVIPAVTMMTGLFLNLVGTLAKIGQGMALFGKGFITGGPIGAVKALTQSSKYLSLAEMDAAMAAQQLSGASQVLNTTLMQQVGTANAAATAIANLTRAYGAMAATQASAGALPSFGVAAAAGANAAQGVKTGSIRVRGIRRNAGGGVPGVGNTDTVPAMLTPGEFVVNKEATKNNLGLLKAINDGKSQGLNKGGMANSVQYLNGGGEVQKLISIIENDPKMLQTILDEDYPSNIKQQVLNHFQRNGSSQKTKKIGSGRTTFAHMQHPLVGVPTAGGAYKGGVPMVSGDDARNFFTRLYESDKESFTRAQQQYFEAGKLNGFSGWSVHGNLGFDISSKLNSGTNNIQDLIDDLEKRFNGGKNPYSTMVSSMGIKDGGDVKKISTQVHKDVVTRLQRLIATGVTTYRDVDLYPHMEKVVPRAISSAIQGTSLSPKIIDELFSPEKKSAAIRARGFTSSDIVRLLESGKLKAANVWEAVSQSGKKKTKVVVPGFEDLGKKVSTSGTRIAAISGSAARKAEFEFLAQSILSLVSRGKYKPIKRNSGGPVPGTGNSDTVPAMLTPGEFVVNKKATSQNQQLLEMMNGGQVKGYALGGVVQAAGAAASIGGVMSGNDNLINAGLVASFAPSIVGFGKKLVQSIGRTAKSVDDMGDAASGTSKGVKNIGPSLKNLATVGGRLSIGMTSMVGGVALAGFAIYKLNESAKKAEKAGAELAEAMYGSAKTTKAMADAFGRETNASALRRKAVEKAGGQEITEESIAASGEFMKSDAAAEIIKDLELVKKSGEDVSLALRNQLTSSIIAGAITPEEAKAIAIDMGKALNDEKLAVQVAGQLSSLIGPNGEKINNNIVEITAEISPQIDGQKIKNDAEKAYEELNIGQKFGQLFSGGRENFIKDFAIDEISERNAAALAKEAESRAYLNLAYQEGTITLKEYLDQESKITSGAKERSSFVEDANAQAMGFASKEDLDASLQSYLKYLEAIKAKDFDSPEAQIDPTQGQKAYETVVSQGKESLKQTFLSIGMSEDAAVNKTNELESVVKTDPAIYDRFISGQMPLQGADVLINLQSTGDLQPEDIDRIGKELTALTTIPKIDKVINFETANEEMITEAYDAYIALEEQPEIFKGIRIEDSLAKNSMEQFGINYEWIMSLPNQEKFIVLTTIERHVQLQEAAKNGDAIDRLALGQSNADMAKLKENTVDFGGTQDFSPPPPGGGGSGKQTLKGYIKEFKDATKAKMDYFKATNHILGTAKQEALALIDTEMYLKANKKQRAQLIKLAEKQLNIQRATAFLSMSAEEKTLLSLEMQEKALDKKSQKEEKALRAKQRQMELNDRALEDLAEKEDAVNEAYDARFEALDKVSEANDRIAEQDRSRISLASALASGDIAAAANAASEMQQQNAQYQIEDTRAALEEQRQRDLESLTVSVNGKLMTRNELEAANKGIQEEVEVIQDTMFNLETDRLTLAEKRADAELRTFLLQQKQTIEALKLKEINGELTKAQKGYLKTLMVDFKNLSGVDYNQYKKYGGSIAKMAFGGVAYKGSTESPPPLRMQYGSTVPGIGMTDKVPALLTPGEFVVRKSVAKQYGGFLNQLNGQVFPGIGRENAIPTNNFLDGIGSPRYSIPEQSMGSIPVNNASSQSSSVYNNTYSVNVNVSGTNASPDDIANVVMAKLSNQNRGNLRSSRY